MNTLEPKQQAKTVIVTALISAVSTISVALLPGLLMAPKVGEVVKVQKDSPGLLGHKAPANPRWRISGRVLDDATDKPVSAQLVLGSATSATDDGGKFVFDHVPEGNYSIVVEIGDSQGKHSSHRYLIERWTDQEYELRSLAGGPSIKGHMGPATHE